MASPGLTLEEGPLEFASRYGVPGGFASRAFTLTDLLVSDIMVTARDTKKAFPWPSPAPASRNPTTIDGLVQLPLVVPVNEFFDISGKKGKKVCTSGTPGINRWEEARDLSGRRPKRAVKNAPRV